jgi:hypothetical protein
MKKAIGQGVMVSEHCLGRCRVKWYEEKETPGLTRMPIWVAIG